MTKGKTSPSFPQNVLWGIRRGLSAALAFSAYVLLLYLFRGAAPFEANDTSLGAVIAAYLFGGLVAGAIIGLLRPFTKRKVGAIIAGIVAAVPVYAAVVFAVNGFAPWTLMDAVFVAVASLYVGALAGFLTWKWTRNRS